MDENITQEQREAYLKEAQAAAAAGDLKKMNDALFKSLVPDGVARNLRRRWPGLMDDDVDSLVAEAVKTLYEWVRDGNKVSRIAGFLVKVAHRKAFKLDRSRPSQDAWDPSDLENFEWDYSDDLESHTERDERVKRALVAARALLSRLGQEGVREVMEVIFDALERGVADMTSGEIAQALGRSNPSTVRQQRKRGFDRLRREARKEGLDFDLSFLEAEEDGDDHV